MRLLVRGCPVAARSRLLALRLCQSACANSQRSRLGTPSSSQIMAGSEHALTRRPIVPRSSTERPPELGIDLRNPGAENRTLQVASKVGSSLKPPFVPGCVLSTFVTRLGGSSPIAFRSSGIFEGAYLTNGRCCDLFEVGPDNAVVGEVILVSGNPT